MRRVACLVGLLLPLVAGAQGTTTQKTPHVWPVTAMAAADAPVPRGFIASASLGFSTEGAVRSLRQARAQAVPSPRSSLLQIDLTRRLCLALLSTPRWTTDARGRRMLVVPLLGLRW